MKANTAGASDPAGQPPQPEPPTADPQHSEVCHHLPSTNTSLLLPILPKYTNLCFKTAFWNER